MRTGWVTQLLGGAQGSNHGLRQGSSGRQQRRQVGHTLQVCGGTTQLPLCFHRLRATRLRPECIGISLLV